MGPREDFQNRYYNIHALAGPSYSVFADGKVYRVQDTSEVFSMEPMPAGARLSPPILSGDGQFIFIPGMLPGRRQSLRVYRTRDFGKLREVTLNDPGEFVAANHNGSILYSRAFAGGRLRGWDSDTLQPIESRDLTFDGSSIQAVEVIQ